MQEPSAVLDKKLHIFDICGTLYKSNTTYDFLLFYFKRNNRFKYLIFKSLLSFPAKIAWKFFTLLGLSYRIRIFLVSYLKNEPVELVRKEADNFVKDFLQSKIILDIAERLKNTLKYPSDVYLVSASIYPVVEAIASKLEVSNFKATELQIANNRYTGRISKELEQKKKSVVCEIDSFLDKNQIFVYTDSFNDSDIVEMSDFAVIVCNKEEGANWLSKFPDKKIEFCYV